MFSDDSSAASNVNVQTNTVVPVIPAQQNQEDDSILQYIASRVARHQCILFLGSGVHVPSNVEKYNYPKEKCPPIGGELAAHLATQCGLAGNGPWNLQRVAQYYESKKKFRYLLVEEIVNVVHQDREPSPVLCALADLGFPLIITTNYDHLYEDALSRHSYEDEQGTHGYEYDLCIYNPDNREATKDCADKPNPQRPYILKLHGDIDEPESIVITDEDYIHFVLRMGDKQPFHPVGKNVLTYLAKWPTLFIGYSLTDYNFRVLFKTIRWQLDAARIPPNYSVDIKPDDLIRDIYENQHRYVTFIVENLWEFVPRLYKEVKKVEMPSCPPKQGGQS
ncbi:MAG TPA: SIR2 family protein [Pyrinomonadaceae bacterium]|jgi:hypothetical protein|nr:SIR2 family protein [Pyrinomonadaceae bacterium]